MYIIVYVCSWHLLYCCLWSAVPLFSCFFSKKNCFRSLHVQHHVNVSKRVCFCIRSWRLQVLQLSENPLFKKNMISMLFCHFRLFCLARKSRFRVFLVWQTCGVPWSAMIVETTRSENCHWEACVQTVYKICPDKHSSKISRGVALIYVPVFKFT